MKTGHPLREGNDSHNKGLFLEMTHLLAQYDTILKDHFQTCARNAVYTSNIVQNELIASVYQNVIQQLKNELGATTCFSVMMDEASDHSHKEQVSIVVRYVDNDFIIQERLIGI